MLPTRLTVYSLGVAATTALLAGVTAHAEPTATPPPPAAAASVLATPWPELESERADLRQQVIDAQPEPEMDPVEAWVSFTWKLIHLQGYFDGAVATSRPMQDWLAGPADVPRKDFDAWYYTPDELLAERRRIAESVLESRHWTELLGMSADQAFLSPWPPRIDGDFEFRHIENRFSTIWLLDYCASKGDIEHFTECIRVIQTTSRVSETTDDFIGRVTAHQGLDRVYRAVFAYRDELLNAPDAALADLATTIEDYELLPSHIWINGERTLLHEQFLKEYETIRDLTPRLQELIDSATDADLRHADRLAAVALSALTESGDETATPLPDPRLDLAAIDEHFSALHELFGPGIAARDRARERIVSLHERMHEDVFAAQRPVAMNLMFNWDIAEIFEKRFGSERAAALTAIAIARYRLAHDQYPTTLEAIVPDYLDAVPIDPYDGQPMRYKLVEIGPGETDYILYSVGYDGVEDGGRVHPKGALTAAHNGSGDSDPSGYDLVFTAIEPL